VSFKNPDLFPDRQPAYTQTVAKARHNYYVLNFLHIMNSEITAEREIKNLTTLRDQCRDLGLREAADCFDTALEATEEGMKALVKGRD